MYKLLLAAVLGAGLVAAAPTAQADVSAKSYAPENLRQLSVRDRTRVLEQEYWEQSGGRRLPDDQRDFYLAQINSGWTFSRIKADIAQSLRGNGNGNGNGNGWGNGQTLRCESIDERYRECRTNFRNRVELVRVLSSKACVEGRSWGQRDGMVWVNWGCRAEFSESRNGWGNGNCGYTVSCSSVYDRYRTCAWNSRRRPVLVETLSESRCVEGRSWGFQGSSIWVNYGCRGRFAESR
jgi:hypothetical protein